MIGSPMPALRLKAYDDSHFPWLTRKGTFVSEGPVIFIKVLLEAAFILPSLKLTRWRAMNSFYGPTARDDTGVCVSVPPLLLDDRLLY